MCLRGYPASQGFRPFLGTRAFQVEGSPILGKGPQGLEDAAFQGVVLLMLTTHIRNE